MTQALPKDVPPTLRRWKSYPVYKDSGVEWLGEIPAHWEVKRLKWVVSQIGSGKTPKGGSQIYSSSGVIFLRSQNIHFDGLRLEDVVYIDDVIDKEMASTRVMPQDVLLNITGASLGRCSIIPSDFPAANVNQHVCIIRPIQKSIQPSFLLSAIASNTIQAQIFSLENGTSREGLTFSQIANLVLAVPSNLSEQNAIASFLDRETAKIDALIAKKERLIELLQEKRTAIINHAVTKGLDPTVPLEDSGVDWLGEVPAHWEVKRIKYLAIGQDCGIQMGPFGGMLKDLSVEETGFKVYGQENTINDDFTAGHRWITYKQLWEMARYAVRKGDLLLTRKGSIGKCRVVPDDVTPGIIDSDTIRVRVNEDQIFKGFLVRLMHEAWYLQEQIVWNSRGAILTGLNTTTIAELRVAVPPLTEQKEIVAYLDRETTKIDALIAKIREGIEKLKEYRTALISAAVTGKIDVRNEVAS
jgi:type I restriction enzyme S subunit